MAAVILGLCLAVLGRAISAEAAINHVLLLSVDGLHSSDLSQFVSANPHSHLAKLGKKGVVYTQAASPTPSDSFPGLQALITGALPITTGIFYDVSYDRFLYPPGSNCTGPAGTVVTYDETVDLDDTKIDGGGGLDPTMLPKKLTAYGCNPLYPHEFNNVGNIFEAVKAAGGTTAWVDKHLAYDIVRGKSGKGVDDLFLTEVASVKVKTVDGYNAYDDGHWAAIMNWIRGTNYNGSIPLFKGRAPTLFGGDLQAFTQMQSSKTAGYVGNFGAMSANLTAALRHVDKKLGQVVKALVANGIYKKTMIIVTAKHGGSPIARNAILDLPSHDFSKIPGVPGEPSGATVDDVALLWLNDQSKALEVARALEKHRTGFHIEKVLVGEELRVLFGDPLKNSRTPDVIAIPTLGTIWGVPKGTKYDHEGFNVDDTHVALLVSNPSRFRRKHAIHMPVSTTQVAATILKALQIPPLRDTGLKIAGTPPLPLF